ncbi:hypothetical protein ACTHGU_08145 [Chitinophagaceae bacterium MMS25-I14]
MTRIFLTALLLASIKLSAQGILHKDNFTHIASKATGDLNKDNIPDMAVVTQDTTDDKEPYRLQVFFGEPGGRFKLVIATTQAIAPRYPEGKGGYATGNDFYELTIEKGVLSISNELLRGHFEHKFRYQNGNFELIGYSEVSSDGNGVMETIDFNLSTGIRLNKRERYDTDKVLSNTKKKIMIRPLPKLQDFKPYDSEYY